MTGMKDKTPLISIILPVFNGEKYLGEAIDSILCQSCTDFELILVNDGSTDRTAEIISRYEDSRIVCLNNTENIGLVRSLNIGLKIVRGTYIARMDADDVSHGDRLRQQLDFIENNPAIGVLGTAMHQVDETGEPFQLLEPPTEHALIAWKMLFECPVFHPTVLMRRTAIEAAGGYDPGFRHVEDIDLWTRMLATTQFANLPVPLYRRRWHKDSICNVHREYQRERTVAVKIRYAGQSLGVTIGKSEYEMMAVGHMESPAMYAPEMVKSASTSILELYAAFIERYHPPRSLRANIEEDIYERISFLKSRDTVNNILYLKDRFLPVSRDILKHMMRKSLNLK
jgi:glycosyltransferase involved in cell wall biosynthesis